MAESQLPWFQSASELPDYRTEEKSNITWWLHESKPVTVSVKDSTNKKIWSLEVKGQKGFNQYRWDLVLSRQTSDLPYFTQFEKWLEAGTYRLILSDGKSELATSFIVKNRTTPYIK
jgi:hypothetical protein